MRRRGRPPFTETGQTFEVGSHLVRLERRTGGWVASADGLAVAGLFQSQAQAWQEGVRAALALDAPVPRPSGKATSALGGELPRDPDQLGTGDE